MMVSIGSALRLVFGLLMLSAATLSAHELRPSYLQITETGAGSYDVLWKVPARGNDQRLALDPRLEGSVSIVGEPVDAFVGDAHIRRWSIKCPDGITGTRIRIDGLNQTFTDALVRVVYADGTEFVSRLQPDHPTTVVPTAPGPGAVAWTYLLLGVEHILIGVDHLLFVLALLLIIEGRRKLIGTITAFTLAHSLTLSFASLKIVRVPGPPVEACIALSIVFVAAEIIRGRQGHPGLTARAPWVVAFTFGLLHGFGFAGALSEIGLPQRAVSLALLFFNVGVELGQLAFIGVVLGIMAGFNRLAISPPVWSWRLLPYGIGGVAMFWVIQRTTQF